jgi:phenylacetate-CoA ligase
VENGQDPGDPRSLKNEIEKLLREKLIFSADVELVPPGTLPKFEYKAKLVEKAYKE